MTVAKEEFDMANATEQTFNGPISNPKVLLVDDNSTSLRILSEALTVLNCDILVARNGQNALSIAEKAQPDLIILDIMMPEMDGHEVCSHLKASDTTKLIPVIFSTSAADDEEQARGLALGAVDYIIKPINPELLRNRVRNLLQWKLYQNQLEDAVKVRTREIQLTQAVMIESLATLAEYRDPETGGHIKRTQNYVKALAMHLKNHPRFSDKLDDDTIELIYLSAPLHDIGKIGVRDEILLKPGPLTDQEFHEMKKHTTFGADSLRITEQKLGKSTFLQHARELAHSHHEKWDGSGYPLGLKGDDIPISGRLMAVADVYDALISKRSYKPPMPHEKAMQIVAEGKGTHFDPDIVEACLELEGVFRNIALTFADYEEENQTLVGVGSSVVEDAARKVNRILLVEDNSINQEVMHSQLVSAGYEVDVVSNGKEALEKYHTGNFDLILTDIEMPEMNGYELVSKIRLLEETTGRDTPILAITSTEFDLNPAKAKDHGFSGHMLKPLDVAMLKTKLAGIL